MVCKERAEALAKKYPLSFLTIVYNSPSLFASQAGDCSVRCGLPAFSKVQERVTYNRLLRFLNNHNILYDNQYCFRRHHSTTYVLAC